MLRWDRLRGEGFRRTLKVGATYLKRDPVSVSEFTLRFLYSRGSGFNLHTEFFGVAGPGRHRSSGVILLVTQKGSVCFFLGIRCL